MVRDIADYASNYSNDIGGFEQFKVIYRRKKILEIMDYYNPRVVLEIGCGLEPLFCHIKKDLEFTIVEPSDKFYYNAEKLSKKRENVTCVKGFFEDVAVRLRDKNYDMVICSGLMHEVSDSQKLLNTIWSVCGDETVIHINVPNMYSLHRILGVEMGILSNVFDKSEGNIKMQQNTNFDMDKLKKMVESNKMKVIDEGAYFIKPFSHKQMKEMLAAKIINENVLEGLYAITKYMPQFESEIFVNCKKK